MLSTFRTFLIENKAEKTLNWLKDNEAKGYRADAEKAKEEVSGDLKDNRSDYMYHLKSHDHSFPELPHIPQHQKDAGVDIHQHYANHLVDTIAQHDPSPDKNHTQWLLNKWYAGHFKHEDQPRVHNVMSRFMQHRQVMGNPQYAVNGKKGSDINSYNTFHQLEDHLETHFAPKISKNEQERQIKHEGAELIHSENGVTVHKIKSKEAACFYGKGTRWCTAADNHNMFDMYNRKGPLYVVQTPEKRKYQFHFQTKQYMDEKDQRIDVDKLATKHPELKNVAAFKEHGMDSMPFLHEHDKKEWAKKTVDHPNFGNAIGNKELDMVAKYGGDEVHQKMAKHKLFDVRATAAEHGSKEIAQKLMSDPHGRVRSMAEYNLVLNHDIHPSLYSLNKNFQSDDPHSKMLYAHHLQDTHGTATRMHAAAMRDAENTKHDPEYHKIATNDAKFHASRIKRAESEFQQNFGHMGITIGHNKGLMTKAINKHHGVK